MGRPIPAQKLGVHLMYPLLNILNKKYRPGEGYPQAKPNLLKASDPVQNTLIASEPIWKVANGALLAKPGKLYLVKSVTLHCRVNAEATTYMVFQAIDAETDAIVNLAKMLVVPSVVAAYNETFEVNAIVRSTSCTTNVAPADNTYEVRYLEIEE